MIPLRKVHVASRKFFLQSLPGVRIYKTHIPGRYMGAKMELRVIIFEIGSGANTNTRK